jgi:hypothetical protein
VIPVRVFAVVHLGRALWQAAALAAAALCLAGAVGFGPPGWRGPWPESWAMVQLFGEAPPVPAPADGRLQLSPAGPVGPGGLEVLYDGHPAAILQAATVALQVRPGDVVELVNPGDRPVRVRVVPQGTAVVPGPDLWVVPARGFLRLPAVRPRTAAPPNLKA